MIVLKREEELVMFSPVDVDRCSQGSSKNGEKREAIVHDSNHPLWNCLNN